MTSENSELDHDHIVAQIAKLMAETGKLNSENEKLREESRKLNAEHEKLQAEALKITRETFWYPMAIASALVGSVAGITLALSKLI